MKTTTNYAAEPFARQCELLWADRIMYYGMRAFGEQGTRMATRDEDLYGGTDCFVRGVPIDLTLNPVKDGVPGINHTRRYSDAAVTFGIRCGNAYAMFDVPVLTLHFEYRAGLSRSNLFDATARLERNWPRIIGDAIAWYDSHVNGKTVHGFRRGLREKVKTAVSARKEEAV